MEKYLIINADDLGMCHAQNKATFELLTIGTVTSATIMAPCSAAREAVAFARNHPQYAIGIHLTATSEFPAYRWRPVCDRPHSTLTDSDGFFHRFAVDVERSADLCELREELEAQICLLTAMGLTPSHLDNHMGTLYGILTGRFELLELALELSAKHRLPFRFPRLFSSHMLQNAMLSIKVSEGMIQKALGGIQGIIQERGIITPDHLSPGDWNGPQAESFENYREYIYELYRKLDHGVTETYIHPACESEELKGITPLWQRRCWEYELFRDPKTAQHIRSLGIKLIDYRLLSKMRGDKKSRGAFFCFL